MAYLIAKYLALAVACAALVLVGILMSALLSNALILLNPAAPTLLKLNNPTIAVLANLYLGTLENYLFCLLLGSALGIISCSAAFGIAAGFGWLIGEDIAAQILPVVGTSLHTALGHQIVTLLFTPNLNAFYKETLPPFLAATLDQLDGVIACNPVGQACVPVSAGHTLLVSLAWASLLGGISTILFLRRDVLQ